MNWYKKAALYYFSNLTKKYWMMSNGSMIRLNDADIHLFYLVDAEKL